MLIHSPPLLLSTTILSSPLHILNPYNTPTPLLIWHGLGDTAHSDGILSFIHHIKQVHPRIFVHSVQIPEGGSLDDERKAGFWGNAIQEAADGCEQISAIPELADGFDAMGFSQGGLFLRDYVQYCPGPPIRNLITFGTPHYGIAALIPCPTPPTLTCLLAARAARSGIYTSYAQTHIIQAAYYRDTERLDEFMEKNDFLRDLNGELRGSKEGREGGGRGVSGLENFIAVAFEQDRTVSPLLSAHFATYSPENKTEIMELHSQPLYIEDWVGLRKLDEKGGLVLDWCEGEHMDLGGKGGCGERIVKDWVGWSP